MSRLLGRLGNVGEVLLKNELSRQQAAYESNLIRQRQKEASEQGVLQNVATKMGDQAVSHRLRPTDEQLAAVDAVNPRIGAMIRAQAGMITSDEQAAGEVAAPLYKEMAGAKSDEDLGSEDARLAQAKSGFVGQNVKLGSGDDNPMWAMQDAYQAQKKQIGVNEEQSRMQAIEDKGKEKLLPGRPQTMGVLQLDENGKPGKAFVLDPATGQSRPATAEDMKNPDIKWESQKPTPPSYYQMMSQVGPMDLRGAMTWSSRANSLGWDKLPPLYGPSGQVDRNRIVALQTFEDKTNPGHFIFENPNYTGPLPKGVTPEEVAAIRQQNAMGADGGAAPQTVDIFSNQVKNLATQKSMGELVPMYNNVKAFAGMANKNAEILKTVMQGIPSAQGPQFLNMEVRDLANQFGAPVMAAFSAAKRAVTTDYSRLTTSPTLKGVLSDRAQHETEQAIAEGATVGQVLAALDVWQQETANREDELLKVIKELGSTRNGIVSGEAGAPAPPVTPQHRPGVVRR